MKKNKKTYRNKLFTVIGICALLLLAVGAIWSTEALVGSAMLGGVLFPIMRDPGAGGGGGTPEEREKAELLKSIEDRVKEIVNGGYTTKEELKHLETKIDKLFNDGGDIAVLKTEMVALASAVKALKEMGLSPENKDSIRTSIKSWQEENKGAFATIKNGTAAGLTPLTLKLNSPMTPSNTYNSSAYLPIPSFIPGATEIVRVQPTFWDYLKKGRVGSAVLVWVNKKNPEGAAAFIGPGVAKPGISFEIATETSNAKKIAESIKVATELLEDIEGLASWIEMELAYQLKAKINTTLMTGAASSTVPAGIQTLSTTYTLTGVETTNPNIFDALVAAVTQLRSGNLQGPVTVFLNPVDYANMLITKAESQGQYMNFTRDLDAVIVVDNNIAVGYVQVALLDYYKILIYKDFTVTFGWENDDFTKNLVTGVGEMRLHQYFSENHTGAFIYDTLENIKTAIDVAP